MIDRGGIVGDDGPTHHGVFDMTFLRAVPNLVVMSPKDENELAAMVRTALEYDEGPIAVRYPRGVGLGVEMDYEPASLPIGKGETLRTGGDMSLIAIGSMVDVARKAAEELAREGIDASVINARFLKPLDADLILEEALRTRRVVTLEENVISGGFGAAVLELLQAEGADGVSTRVVALPDEFVTHGSASQLLSDCGLTVEDVVKVARRLATAQEARRRRA
jgi:1-deoxy-D-xylulose-5-phosphate synthase